MGPHRPPQNADLSALEEKLGHRFRDRSHLELALTHSSSTTQPLADNERMEFLGDAVLALAVNEQLYRTIPDEGEGELTRIKSAAVSTITLARVARALGLGEFMRLGKGLGDRGGLPDSVLANVTEAILAAIYLDAGLDPAKALVIRLLEPEIAALTTSGGSENAKSQLQELAQRRFGCAPRYRLLRESGPQHYRRFEIAVEIRGRSFQQFVAHTKKEAEQGAARLAIEALAAPEKRPAQAAPRPEAPAAAVAAAPATGGQPAGRRRRHRGGRGRHKAGSAAPKPVAQKPAAPVAAPKPAAAPQKAAGGRRGRGRGGRGRGQNAKAAAAGARAPAAPAPVQPVRRIQKISKNPYDMLGEKA